ncbi:hypothetical protein IMY05_006G0161000 [Salix suchowensis]|nr:hypothetical protein IMY05_006G0161000 [Salix suchowensis]
MWLPQHSDSSNLSRLGQSARHQVKKRGTFLFSFFLVCVILLRVLVSSSRNVYGFIFFSLTVSVAPVSGLCSEFLKGNWVVLRELSRDYLKLGLMNLAVKLFWIILDLVGDDNKITYQYVSNCKF